MFKETIKILSGFFYKRESLFHTRYKCLNIVKQENENFVTYEGNGNSPYELFKLGDFPINMFNLRPGTYSSKEQRHQI